MEFTLSAMPNYLLARCIQLGLRETEIEQAAKTPAFYRQSDYEYSLGVFLLLQTKAMPVVDEESFVWLQKKVFISTYDPEDWPNYEELVVVSRAQSLELMVLHMARRPYFAARRAGINHSELVSAVKQDKYVSLDGYAKLRQTHKLGIKDISKLIDDSINLHFYAEILEKKYPKELLDKVMADFGTDLYPYILAVEELGLEPNVVFDRKRSEGGFDIYKYKELRRRGLNDEKAWEVLRDPELLNAMRVN